MRKNTKLYIIGLISIAFTLFIGGGIVYGEQLLDHVAAEKVAGDRFSVLDFNDIWEFIRRVFIIGDNSIGISVDPRVEIDGMTVTFDLGNQVGTEGVLAVDAICSDTSCATTDSILAMESGGGAGQFVGVTDSSTYNSINGVGTSSLDSTGKTTGNIVYDPDGTGAELEMTGYVAANALCKVALANDGARICTEDEIVRTIDSNFSAFSTFATETFGWVTGGGSKYTSGVPVDDCDGFTYNAGSAHVGNIWKLNTAGGAGSAQPCITPTRIACCL